MALKRKFGASSKKKKTSGFRDKFQKRNENVLQKTFNEKDERSKAGGGGVSIFDAEKMSEFGITEFKPESGDNYFEVMPLSFDANVPYFQEVPVHYSVGFSNDSFICTSRFNGKKCFRCEEQQKQFKKLGRATKGSIPKDITDLYPTDRSVYLIWTRTKELVNGDDAEYQLQVWAAPKKAIHAEIQSLVRDKRHKTFIDVSDVSANGDGRTVNFEYVLPKKKNEFPSYTAIQLMERDDDIPDEILEQLDCLIEAATEEGFDNLIEMLLVVPEYETVKDSMLTEVSDDEEDEKDNKSTTKKSKDETDEEEITEALEELKEELEKMRAFSFKKWCKNNGYEEALNIDDQEEAIDAIIDDVYQKALEGEETILG